MGKFFLYLLIVGNFILSIREPWIGITIAYLVTILTPQNIWWWCFEGIRPFYSVVVPPLIGFLLATFQSRINWGILKSKFNIALIIIWLSIALSYYFGPYVDVQSPYKFFDPAVVFSNLNKTFLLYFVGVLLINNLERLKCFSAVIILVTLYMTYWANLQYLNGHYMGGRLHGPRNIYGIGIYGDENIFASLIIVGIPFLYYSGFLFPKKILRVFWWLIIPFSWHAIFLTGSRGGLLALFVITLMITLRSKSRAIGLGLLCVLIIAYGWQGGDVLKKRAQTITQYEQESSAMGRIHAWKAAIGMMTAHPLTGVGVASFGPAFPHFSQWRPRIAHNTFFQIAAENGIIAGCSFLFLLYYSIKILRKNSHFLKLKQHKSGSHLLIYLINESAFVAIVGFSVSAFFLSLQEFDYFYYLIIIINSLNIIMVTIKEKYLI